MKAPLAVSSPLRRALSRFAVPVLFTALLVLTALPVGAQQPPKGSEPKSERATRSEKERRPGARPSRPAGARQKNAPTAAERKRRLEQAKKRRTAQADRWSRLSPQKRKRLEAVYDQLKKLPPEKRELLLERLRKLDSNTRRERIRTAKKRLESDEAWLDRQSRQTRRELLESLPTKTRERLQKLPPKERQKHLQKLVAARRAKLIETLPPDVAAEIRRLPPGKQTQRLKQYRTTQIFRRTFQDRREAERLRKLPRKELRKLLSVKDTEESPAPKPDYLSARTWKRWKALKRFERERILRLIRTGGDLRSGRATQERPRSGRGRAAAPPRQPAAKAKGTGSRPNADRKR